MRETEQAVDLQQREARARFPSLLLNCETHESIQKELRTTHKERHCEEVTRGYIVFYPKDEHNGLLNGTRDLWFRLGLVNAGSS